MTPSREPTRASRLSLSFQTRLTLTLLAAAIVPLGVFGLVLIASGTVDPQVGSRLLLFMFAVAVAVGILAGAAIGLDLVRPLRQISAAVERVSAGDLSQPIPIEGSDVLAQLAESHNRLAGDAQRRNRQLGLILAAVESAEPRDGVDALAERAARDAQIAFGFISAELRFVDPDSVEAEERIPGVSLPVRAELRAGDDRMGLILASLPATHSLGTGRPGPVRPVRQRDRRRHPQCRAVHPGPGEERPAAPAERGQGRLPARRQPQPPDALDLDQVERRSDRGVRPRAGRAADRHL